jgi:TonB family protein
MEALVSYLLQMACWLAAFWLVYVAVLRKETFFELNRWFLLFGLAASLVFPLFPFKYDVVKEPVDLAALKLIGSTAIGPNAVFTTLDYWLVAYLSGVLVFLFRFAWQSVKLYRLRSQSEWVTLGSTPIFRLEKDTAPFSFFNSIFVSKTLCGETELKAVVAHEKVHIDERHWADLLLLEVARTLQWFNPLLILYRKAVMQNHEFLADSGTLRNGVSAHTYKAVLANQMLGVPVFQVANGFTLFNPTKRILMMNKDKTSPAKRLKLLWALPVMALLMVAFAKPNYVTGESTHTVISSGVNTITVKGKVVEQLTGKPLPGTSIIVRNTTTGTVSDIDGNFLLSGIKPDDELVFSFVGFATVIVKAKKELDVKMLRSVIAVQTRLEEVAPPPPPPPPLVFSAEKMEGNNDRITMWGLDSIKTRNGSKPLIVVDGKISNIDINKIDPENIEKIEVLKDQSAIAVYGNKGKEGVILITTKKEMAPPPPPPPADEPVFIVVEDMPEYPGGTAALNNYIAKSTAGANEKGNVVVKFTVDKQGKTINASVLNSASKSLDKKALEIINSMPKWKPGMQRGKAVDVEFSLEVQF